MSRKSLCAKKCELNRFCMPQCINPAVENQALRTQYWDEIFRIYGILFPGEPYEPDISFLKNKFERHMNYRCADPRRLPLPQCVRTKDAGTSLKFDPTQRDWAIRQIQPFFGAYYQDNELKGFKSSQLARLLRHIQFPEDDATTLGSSCAYSNILRNIQNSCYVDSTIVAMLAVPNIFVDRLLLEASKSLRDNAKRAAQLLESYKKLLHPKLEAKEMKSARGWLTKPQRGAEELRACTLPVESRGQTGDPIEYFPELMAQMDIKPWTVVKMERGDRKEAPSTNVYLVFLNFISKEEEALLGGRPATIQNLVDLSERIFFTAEFLVLGIQRRRWDDPETVWNKTIVYPNEIIDVQISGQAKPISATLVLTGIVSYEPNHYTAYFPCGGWWWYYDDQNQFLLERLSFAEVQDDTKNSGVLFFYSRPEFIPKDVWPESLKKSKPSAALGLALA